VTQIGKKIHDGGLKAGFSNKINQFSRDEAVNAEPIAPASWQSNTEARSLKEFTF
jgi:hypothetical protein